MSESSQVEEQSQARDSRFVRCLPFLLFLLAFVWLFSDALFRLKTFTYRDAGRFYHPLFRLVQEEWNAGRIPLWNPYDNCGTPLLANGTSSVFYPGKFVFFLPVGYELAFNIYILGHVLLAGTAAYLLARNWQASRIASTICCVSYALCGNVMTHYGNVVFLVSAAWLPCAVWAIDCMLQRGSVRAAVVFGVVMALMVLGGDPQMAYHAVLLAALYAIVIWRRGHPAEDSTDARPRSTVWKHPVALLVIAGSCGLVLSAVQVLPSLEWSAVCTRNQYVVPRNIYDIPGYLAREQVLQKSNLAWYDGLLGKAGTMPHLQRIYGYSVAPWKLIEFLWPGVNGRNMAQSHRWMLALAYEDDWVPSLYMGVVPFLLAVVGWRVRDTDARARWISLFVLLAGLGSFGKYGLAWFMRQAGITTPLGDACGGLYWLMTVLLPTYTQFRYPAKLLVLAALGLSLLAAIGWDQMMKSNDSRRLRRLLLVVAGMSAVGFVAAFTVRPLLGSWLCGTQTSSLLGPFDFDASFRSLIFGILQTAIVCGLVWMLLKNREIGNSQKYQFAILAVIVFDIVIGNCWMVETTPLSAWNDSAAKKVIDRSEEQHADIRKGVKQPFRVHRVGPLEPEQWSSESSPRRLDEIMTWSVDVLEGKQNSTVSLQTVTTMSTFRNHDHSLFLTKMSIPNSTGEGNNLVNPRRALDALNTKYFILPSSSGDANDAAFGLRHAWNGEPNSQASDIALPQGELLEVLNDKSDDETTFREIDVVYNSGYLARARIVHKVISIPPIRPYDYAELSRTTQDITFPHNPSFNLVENAVIETTTINSGIYDWEQTNGDQEYCRIVEYAPQRIEIEATLTSRGLVVLSDLYEKNWVAEISSDQGVEQREVIRTNRIMRGVMLDPGEYRIVFRYVPNRFYQGAIISAMGWLLLIFAASFRYLRSNRSTSPLT